MRIFSLCFGIMHILIFCLISCGSGGSVSEEQKVALEYWDARLTKCGDSYYYQLPDYETPSEGGKSQDRMIVQFKGVSFNIITVQPTEADKLNGIEWKGYTAMKYSAKRTCNVIDVHTSYISNSICSDWTAGNRAGDSQNDEVSCLTKVKEHGWIFSCPWTTYINTPNDRQDWKKIGCSQLPNDLL